VLQLYLKMGTIISTLRSFWQQLGAKPSSARILPAYAALGRYRNEFELEPRLRLLVMQLAAERSGCRWCIEYGRHRWRDAQLSMDSLPHLLRYETSGHFSSRERAALRLADAVTRYADATTGVIPPELTVARQHLSEREIAAVTAVVAATHFYNPQTGGLGADAEPRAPRHAAWGAPVGSSIRNLWL
jgi:alkylhydroperoxidase family enzyme